MTNHQIALAPKNTFRSKPHWKPYPAYKPSGIQWLGEIPEHWQAKRLKFTITGCQNGLWGDEPLSNAEDIACVRVADFDRVRNCVADGELTIRNIPRSQWRSRLLKKDDLLLEKSGGGELQPVGVVVIYERDCPAVCSNFVARMPVAPDNEAKFLCYLHAALYAGRINVRSIKQNTGIQNLDSDMYLNERVGLPPRSEQDVISTFLDREMARIDSLIEKKQRQIELLHEKRAALISHAVTQGLDPNVRMKDSGIEWLGEIPAHWEARRLKRVAEARFSGVDKHSVDSEQTVRLCNYVDVYYHDRITSDLDFMTATATPDEVRRFTIKEGDVLVTKDSEEWDDIAVPAFVSEQLEGVICGYHLALIRAIPGRMNGRFLFRAFSACGINDQFRVEATGITRYGLSKYGLNNALFPVPPLPEQHAIAAFLDREMTRIDALVGKVEKSIELLREFRSALISGAITGSIDVRAEAAAC